MNSVAALPCET